MTESHRWEAPELFAANQNYPWPLKTTLTIANPIEEYQQVQITTRHGENYASTTIYPLAMKSIDYLVETRVWKVSVEDKLFLEFSGTGHKTMRIESSLGYKVYRMEGVRCS